MNTKKAYQNFIDNTTTIIAKVKLADGTIADAILSGQKDGDLFGGEVFIDNKKYTLGEGKNRLPKKYFPFKSIGKTPFIDVEVNSE